MKVEVKAVPDTSNWEAVKGSLDRKPTPWGSLSWISARALIDSVNHALSLGSNGLVDQLRRAWVERMRATTGGSDEPERLIIHRPDATRFLIVGDPGEQDASQYVVAPAVAAAVRDTSDGPPADFVLIMSDVIYPAGEVDQYADGFYRPFRNPDETMFQVEAPIIALPGNHDWYDGLSGFMFHFCHQDQLGDQAYGPGEGWRSYIFGRLFRILWRRAAEERGPTRSQRDAWPPGHRYSVDPDGKQHPHPRDVIIQPGPYYAVQTRHLLLVCIDTGIDGNIDHDQWDWLKEVSARPGPKVLVTGKPLVVNGKVVECWVDRKPKKKRQATTESVWKLVHDPVKKYNYIATLGGDTHNYQGYREQAETGLQVHLVSGGGGAYTHATHPYPAEPEPPKLAPNLFKEPPQTFPSRAESLAFFVNLLIPSVIRTVFVLVAAVIGASAVLGFTCFSRGPDEALLVTRIGDVALIAMLVLAGLRLYRRDRPRESSLARWITLATALLTGVLCASIAYRLDPGHFALFVRWWLLLTLVHCLFGGLLRRSGWWRPWTEFERRPLHTAWFVPGLIAVSVGAGYLVRVAGANDSLVLPLWAGIGFFVGGLLGWGLRHWLPTRGWRVAGLVCAPLGQATVVGIALVALVNRIERPELAWGALGALLLAIVILVVGMLTVLLVTQIGGWAGHWAAVAKITHHFPSFLFIAGTLWWTSQCADSPAQMIAAGLPIVMFTVVGSLLLVGFLRRKLGQGYLVLVVVVAVVVPGLYLVHSFGARAVALPDRWQATVQFLGLDWAVPVALGTAVVLLALVVSVVLGHLTFLNAQLLFVRPHRLLGLNRPRITVAEAQKVIKARADKLRKAPSKGLNDAWQYARITWPDLDEPGGPLQGKVSEIYSSDAPPFHKNFLELTTKPEELTITVHEVFVPVPPHGLINMT